jgi:hypothetical protein
MKKIIIAAFILLSLNAVAQKEAIPTAAKSAFSKAFPTASKVKWEKEDGKYEVTFEKEGKEMSAVYDATGKLHESEVSIAISDLPTNAITYMKDHYIGITLKAAAKITYADGSINYEAAIKGKDVLFDQKGQFIKVAKD